MSAVDFLHPKAGSLSDKPASLAGKLRIVKPTSSGHPQRSHSRRQPSDSSSSAASSSSASLSTAAALSTSMVDSLSLTSTSTFPAAYTAPTCPTPTGTPRHARRSVSSSALPSPSRSSASAVTGDPSTSSPSHHQRAHTAEELSRSPPSQPNTPRQTADSTPPQSPFSADESADPTLPPTVRKPARPEERFDDARQHSVSGNEADRTKRMDSSVGAGEAEREGEGVEQSVLRLEEGEEESEELTNTTLADASLPESEDGDEQRKRREDGEGSGNGNSGGGDGNGGGGNRTVDESVNESTDGIDAILRFIRQSILSLSPAASSASQLTLDQLSSLSSSALLSLYKAALSPVVSAHSEVAVLRDEVRALRVQLKETELEGLKECKRQVEKAKAEVEAKYSEELRRSKDRRDKKHKTSRCNSSSSRHNTTLTNVSYINQSLSFHEMSIDPTLSLTTDMLEPRTVTFTLSTVDLQASHSPHANVTLALFSSRLACHSLWNFVGQTESRMPPPLSAGGATVTFDRRLVMRDVKTWHARDKLRVSVYWLAVHKAGGEESKEMMGQVECDTYRLFTAFNSQPQLPAQSVSWEMLKAQETTDAIQGYSSRQLCVPLVDERGMQCGGSQLLIQAHISPPLTCDAYPPSPERVKRAGRGALHVDVNSSLNLSLIDDSHAHFNHSLAAPSFIENEPLSPILPTKRTNANKRHTAALDRTQREADTANTEALNTTARAASSDQQCVATQCEAVHAIECGAQTDTPLVVPRVYRDAGTMTDEQPVPARPALTICTQESCTVEPALNIVTRLDVGVGGSSSCDNSPVVFHQEASACSSVSPSSSPHHASSACSSAHSSPTSAPPASVPAASFPTAASPLQATLMMLSTALSVPFPLPQAKLSNASQHSLQRILGLLRRQYSSSLQWFLDTATASPPTTAAGPAHSKQSNKAAGSSTSSSSANSNSAANGLKPTWNPSINPAAPSRLLSSIRLHSHWQPDSSVSSCSHCQSSFSLLKRKHHCRLCGSTACDECSKKSVELGELGLPGLQRVCDVCEVVWCAGKGLKAVAMPVVLLEVTMAPARDDEPQSQKQQQQSQPVSKQQAAAGKGRRGSADDGKHGKLSQQQQQQQQQQQDDELNVTAAEPVQSTSASSSTSAQLPSHTTPTVGRTARVRPTPSKRVGDKERETGTPATARRVTRSAAKENANTLNVPAAIPEQSSTAARRALKAKAAAVPIGGAVRGGRS